MAKKNKNLMIYSIIGIIVVAIIIGLILIGSKSNNIDSKENSNAVVNNTQVEEPKIKKTNTGFVSDILITNSEKIKKELIDWNNSTDENLSKGMFTNINVSEKDNSYFINYNVTDDVMSVFMLNLMGMISGLKVYESDSDFENINITYLDNKNQKLGELKIPNKAVKDIYDYNKTSSNNDILENPYVDAYYKLTISLYDPSLPQFVPVSVSEELFGSVSEDASEIDKALTKTVTHLEIDCWGAKNWDADADDDGILYYVLPKANDGTIVPIEGTILTEAYSIKGIEGDFGFITDYRKDEKIYTKTTILEGKSRFDSFDLYDGYSVRLEWSEVEPYMASNEDYGYLYVTFTDKQNNSYSAKIEDNGYSNCYLRED